MGSLAADIMFAAGDLALADVRCAWLEDSQWLALWLHGRGGWCDRYMVKEPRVGSCDRYMAGGPQVSWCNRCMAGGPRVGWCDWPRVQKVQVAIRIAFV